MDNILIDYWKEILCSGVIIICSAIPVMHFLKLSRDEKLSKVQGWLLSAVILAEKEFGGGTGKLKLSYVYDKFVDKFPWIAKTLSFQVFSVCVDNTLVEMRNILSTNKAIAEIVETEVGKHD